VLATVRHHHDPFPFFRCEHALQPDALAWLVATVADPTLDWQRHDTFYKAWLTVLPDGVQPRVRREMLTRMRQITGLPLADRTRITLQRMGPGDHAQPHTDQPQLGYESARVIVQLNRAWEPQHGGQTCLHPDPQGDRTTVRLKPTWNTALGFAMGARTWHSVQPTSQERRTAVFHFWHRGNSEAFGRWLRPQVHGMRFDRQPAAVQEHASNREHTHPEEQTFRAATVAQLLVQWGCEGPLLIDGYEAGLAPLLEAEGTALVLFARWCERLAHGGFEGELWEQIRALLANEAKAGRSIPSPELAEGLALAFPVAQ
jgi:hypothetical protein